MHIFIWKYHIYIYIYICLFIFLTVSYKEHRFLNVNEVQFISPIIIASSGTFFPVYKLTQVPLITAKTKLNRNKTTSTSLTASNGPLLNSHPFLTTFVAFSLFSQPSSSKEQYSSTVSTSSKTHSLFNPLPPAPLGNRWQCHGPEALSGSDLWGSTCI